MDVNELLKERRERILQIAEKHGVSDIRVFGSVARGEANPDSDIDFLIDAPNPTTAWFPGGLIADLEELLGRHVDVVERDAIRPAIRERILKEAVAI